MFRWRQRASRQMQMGVVDGGMGLKTEEDGTMDVMMRIIREFGRGADSPKTSEDIVRLMFERIDKAEAKVKKLEDKLNRSAMKGDVHDHDSCKDDREDEDRWEIKGNASGVWTANCVRLVSKARTGEVIDLERIAAECKGAVHVSVNDPNIPASIVEHIDKRRGCDGPIWDVRAWPDPEMASYRFFGGTMGEAVGEMMTALGLSDEGEGVKSDEGEGVKSDEGEGVKSDG